MKLLRFSFACSRKVAVYAQMCNRYLDYAPLWITIGWCNGCFFLEAKGEQAELETLAAAIGKDFLYSVWMTDARIEAVDSRIGGRIPLKTRTVIGPFCQHCHPLFADNQSPQFGQTDLVCPVCHGEQHPSAAISFADIQGFAQQLREQGEVTLAVGGHRTTLRTLPFTDAAPQRAHVLVCNPNRLAAHFSAEHHHVMALSSVEKPVVTLFAKPSSQQPPITQTLYGVRFAWHRALSVLAEILRQQGVDYLFYRTDAPQLSVAWVANQWSECDVDGSGSVPAPFAGLKAPLHDRATVRGLQADWHKNIVTFALSDPFRDTSDRTTHALCALHAGSIESDVWRHQAVIYFSNQSPGQLVVLDPRLNPEVFFRLRPLPQTGQQWWQALEAQGRHDLLSRFSARFQEDTAQLMAMHFTGLRDNLTTLFAACACVMGLATTGQSVQQLADRVIAAAMSFQGKNAHRIDIGFDESLDDNQESNISISGLDFYQTLASVMAFRLATDGDDALVPKLAFGIMDSLADHLATWIEHLDGKHGIEQVVLAGNEMANECLAQRLAVRVGKNFPLFANRRLALDSSNLSVGALLLKQRRGRGW